MRVITFTFLSVMMLGLGACGPSASNSGSSENSASAAATRGLGLNGVGNFGTWAIEWQAPRSLSVVQNSYATPNNIQIVFEYPSDTTLESLVCFNNNMHPRCASNPQNVKDVVDLDPTLLQGIQLNLTLDDGEREYVDVSFSASVRTHRLEFSTQTGLAKVDPSTERIMHYRTSNAGICSRSSDNAVSFWPSTSEAAFPTALYLHEEYGGAKADSNNKIFYTGPFIKGARVVTRGVRVSETASVGEWVPRNLYHRQMGGNLLRVPYSNTYSFNPTTVVAFGQLGSSTVHPQAPIINNDGTISETHLHIENGVLSTGVMGYFPHEPNQVITGICIEGTKKYSRTDNPRPILLKMQTKIFSPRLVDCQAEPEVCNLGT